MGEVRLAMHGTTIVICDSGPGLPSSIDPQQFRRFQRGARLSGEGLGLSIVQRIVEHLGWGMTVESSEKGCRFTPRVTRYSTADNSKVIFTPPGLVSSTPDIIPENA